MSPAGWEVVPKGSVPRPGHVAINGVQLAVLYGAGIYTAWNGVALYGCNNHNAAEFAAGVALMGYAAIMGAAAAVTWVRAIRWGKP